MDSFFYLTLSDISAAIIGFDIKKAGPLLTLPKSYKNI
jgi:hypothetical protein